MVRRCGGRGSGRVAFDDVWGLLVGLFGLWRFELGIDW